jgi:hypothetical protein
VVPQSMASMGRERGKVKGEREKVKGKRGKVKG